MERNRIQRRAVIILHPYYRRFILSLHLSPEQSIVPVPLSL